VREGECNTQQFWSTTCGVCTECVIAEELVCRGYIDIETSSVNASLYPVLQPVYTCKHFSSEVG